MSTFNSLKSRRGSISTAAANTVRVLIEAALDDIRVADFRIPRARIALNARILTRILPK